jgi:hypothetical protein
MKLSFKNWMEIYGGHTPPKQDPTKVGQGAFADFHGPEEADPKNPEGDLPPVNRRRLLKKKMKRKEHGR